MSIKTIIHSISQRGKSAVLTIQDGDIVLVDKKNIGIQLNDDGTANTEWLKLYTKYVTYHERLVRIDKTEKDLL